MEGHSKAEVKERIPIKEYMFILKRYSILIIFCFIVVTITSYYYSKSQKKIYQAQSRVEYKPSGAEESELFSPVQMKSRKDFETEVEKLKSRTYGERVARKLGYLEPKIIEKSVRNLVFVDLHADETVPYGNYQVVFQDEAGSFDVFNPSNEVIGSGQMMEYFSTGGLEFQILECDAQPGKGFIIQLPNPAPAGEHISNMTTINQHKKTNLFNIIVQHSDPDEATRIANVLAELAVEADKEAESSREKKMVDFIEGVLRSIREKLDRAEAGTAEYEEESGKISLSKDISDQLNQKTGMEIEMHRRQLDLTRYHEMLKELRTSDIGKYQDLNISLSNLPSAKIQNLTTQLDQYVLQRRQMLKSLTRAHPDVQALEETIITQKDEIVKSIEKEISTLEKDISVYRRKLAELDRSLKDLPTDKLQYTRLIREQKMMETIFTQLYMKLEEARISMASEAGHFSIVDRAITPRWPVSPKIKRNTVVGAIVGLFLGFGLAFFLEYLDNTVKSVRDVETKTGLPVYGIIPLVSGRFGKGDGTPGDLVSDTDLDTTKKSRFLFTDAETSHILEAYRSLRTNISFADFEHKDKKIFLFTSAGPKEGKSTTVANLAYITAQMGSRTLLFDCDLRRPVLHSTFSVPKSPGLTNVLSGGENLGDVIYQTKFKNLSVIPSGTIPPNPSELLGSEKMKQLLEAVKPHFDMIFIDTPPTVTFTDSSVLSTCADGVFIVAEPRRTTEEALLRSIRLIENVNGRIIGIVVNKISPKDSYEGYSYYYYNYYYGYYYYRDGKRKKRKKSRKKVEEKQS